MKGQQCKEADAAQVNSSEWRAGDTCFEWTFDHDRKTWHCWAVYLRDRDPEGRPTEAGCVGVAAFADEWPEGLPTPPPGVERINWWCENRALSPDFVKAYCSILDTEAARSGGAGR